MHIFNAFGLAVLSYRPFFVDGVELFKEEAVH